MFNPGGHAFLRWNMLHENDKNKASMVNLLLKN